MRASLWTSVRHVRLAAVFVGSISTSAIGQLPNASTAAFAMGGNYTAMARGFEAVAWNPANLAMPGRPFFSLGIGAFGGSAGLDPIDLNAFHKFSGQVVDSATRVAWIEQARLSGGQRVRVEGGVTPLALSVGPIGLQLGSSLYSNMNLSPDAFEAMLFGNAGRTGGQAKDLDFTGTSVRSAAFTTGALSLALPLPFKLTGGLLANERAAIAITGKYVLGSGVVVAQDGGSTLVGDDVQLRFPLITVVTAGDNDVLPSFATTEFNGANAGSGSAADVSLAWSGGPWRVGILAENVFNSFKWDTTVLAFRPGTGTVSADTSFTNFDQFAYGAAPQALRDIVEAQKFAPTIGIGMAFEMISSLTLTADLRTSMGDENAIVIGPKSRFGVGAEWRVLPFIPLRAGVASVTDGWQAGVGAGLRFFGYELGAATSIRRRGVATESGFMIGIIGIGR